VAAESEEKADPECVRQKTLAECVGQLSEFHRKLLQLHYTLGQKIKDIAGDVRAAPDAIYKALQRARADLRRCVDRKMSKEDRP
jgi:DNA-directed RNA polymerase specialized sigma24 family protein